MKRRKIQILMFFPAIIFFLNCSGKIVLEEYNVYPYSVFLDKNCTEEELYKASEKLIDYEETPDFWNNIANDLTYPAKTRLFCVYQLFSRHLPPNSDLLKLREIMKNAKWYVPIIDNISPLIWISGHLPMQWDEDNEMIYVLTIMDEYDILLGIFIKINNIYIHPKYINDLIAGNKIEAKVKDSIAETYLTDENKYLEIKDEINKTKVLQVGFNFINNGKLTKLD